MVVSDWTTVGKRIAWVTAVLMCWGASVAACADLPKTAPSESWNPKAAAAYLDQREGWWMAWPNAARAQGTFCVSCHTAVPYALARPTLRKLLGEDGSSAQERALLDDVTKRVRLWKDIGPFYTDQYGVHKAAESRGTEAVLNALILACHDAQDGRLSSDTRVAFNNMWTLQQTTGDDNGAWRWLQFNNEPFEARDSQFYGAALAAVAVGSAPENYRATPAIRDGLDRLREYLKRQYAAQSTINRVVLLWAAAKLPGLLDSGQQKSLVSEVFDQQRADGGWCLASLAWTWTGWGMPSLIKMWMRSDVTPLSARSDGYATGLITFALLQVGVPRGDVHLQRALAWLTRNQNQTEGQWAAYSLNHRSEPSTYTGRFMDDAATAYAVLALTDSQPR